MTIKVEHAVYKLLDLRVTCFGVWRGAGFIFAARPDSSLICDTETDMNCPFFCVDLACHCKARRFTRVFNEKLQFSCHVYLFLCKQRDVTHAAGRKTPCARRFATSGPVFSFFFARLRKTRPGFICDSVLLSFSGDTALIEYVVSTTGHRLRLRRHGKEILHRENARRCAGCKPFACNASRSDVLVLRTIINFDFGVA